MEVVIKIPDYNLDEVQNGSIASGVILKAVKNGTPYNPSGDCISRSVLKTELEVYRHTRNYKSDEDEAQNDLLDKILEDIDNAQAIPQVTVFTENADEKAVADLKAELQNVVEARPQGEWINREAVSNTIFPFWERYECNQCHKFNGYSNFCPNCGADMKGGAE